MKSDSIIDKTFTRTATNSGLGYLPFRNGDLERLQAVTGLIHMQTLTPEARQLITSLRTNAARDIASAAGYVLKSRAALGDSSCADLVKNVVKVVQRTGAS